MNNSGKPTELKLGAVERLAQLTKVVNTAFVMRPKQAIDSIIGEQSIDQEKIERCTIVSVILMDFFYPKDQTALDLHLLLSMDEREDILKSLDCIKDGSDYSKLVIASLIPMIE